MNTAQPRVTVHCSGTAWLLPLPKAGVRRALAAMLAAVGADMPVELYVLRDGAVARHNLHHMGCAGPTNILSFPGGPTADGGMPAALLLSADTLRRECLLYGQRPATHLLRLLAHGLAHALGHDHSHEMDELCEHMETAAHALREC